MDSSASSTIAFVPTRGATGARKWTERDDSEAKAIVDYEIRRS